MKNWTKRQTLVYPYKVLSFNSPLLWTPILMPFAFWPWQPSVKVQAVVQETQTCVGSRSGLDMVFIVKAVTKGWRCVQPMQHCAVDKKRAAVFHGSWRQLLQSGRRKCVCQQFLGQMNRFIRVISRLCRWENHGSWTEYCSSESLKWDHCGF